MRATHTPEQLEIERTLVELAAMGLPPDVLAKVCSGNIRGILQGQEFYMNTYKDYFAVDTDARTLARIRDEVLVETVVNRVRIRFGDEPALGVGVLAGWRLLEREVPLSEQADGTSPCR